VSRTPRGTVCIVGSLNMDSTLRVARLPAPGETVLASRRYVAPGGKGANQAAAAATVGGPVAMVGAVGADDSGKAAADSLRRRGVDVSPLVVQPAVGTGVALVVVDDDGENLIVVDAGANATLEPAAAVESLQRLRPAVTLVQLEIPLPCVEAVVSSAYAGRVVLNPAPAPADVTLLRGVLDEVDLLVPNRSELGALSGRPEPTTLEEVDACVAALRFAGEVVVTLGADGAAVYPRDGERVTIPTEPVAPVNTSGAGDVFCGVLAARLAAGDALVEAATRANRAAARSTQVDGAQVPPDFTP